MTPLTTIAALALAAFVAGALALALGRPLRAWWVPAALALALGALSAAAIAAEGPVGFWAEHTDSLWGTQVWVDLLLAFGIGWALLVPRARALGMRPLPWLGALLLTGSIGLLAMLARVLYLQEREAPAVLRQPALSS